MDIVKGRKAILTSSAEHHTKAIDKDLNTLISKAEKIVVDTVLTMGILFSTVVFYKMLSNKGCRKRSKNYTRLMGIVRRQLALHIVKQVLK